MIKYIPVVFIGFLLFVSCTGKKSDSGSEAADNIIFTEAICIQNNTPLYKEPGGVGPVISYVPLGEVVHIITDKLIDKEPDAGIYYEAHLSNGTAAWISGSAIYTNAVPAAVMEEADIYTGPERENKTGYKFYLAEFVLITKENKEWVNLIGSGKEKMGWVKKKSISTEPGNVQVAILAQIYLLENNGKLIEDRLPDFIGQLPDTPATLTDKLQQIMDNMVADAVEQSIMDYQEQQIDESKYEED